MRLIDADRLKSAIHTDFSEHFTLYHDTDQTALFDMVMDDIDEMPTAFDKEKVIKELREELNLSDAEKERCARENPLQFDSAKGYANGIANAIEIVEKGGLNEKAQKIS